MHHNNQNSLQHQNSLAQQLQRSQHAQQHHSHHSQQQHGVQLTPLQSLLSHRSSNTSNAHAHSPAECHSPDAHQPPSQSPSHHHPSPGTASLHFPHFSSSMIPHMGSNHLTHSRAGSHQLLSQSRSGSAHGGSYALAALNASSAGRQHPATYGCAPPPAVAGYMHTQVVQVTHTQDGGVMTHNRQGSGGLSAANSASTATLRESASTGSLIARTRTPTNEVIVG